MKPPHLRVFVLYLTTLLIGCASSSSYLKTRIKDNGKVYYLEPSKFTTANSFDYTFKPDFTIVTYDDSQSTFVKMNFSLIGKYPVDSVKRIQFFVGGQEEEKDTVTISNSRRFLVKEKSSNKWVNRFTSKFGKKEFIKVLKEGENLEGVIETSKANIDVKGGNDWKRRKKSALQKLSVTLNVS